MIDQSYQMIALKNEVNVSLLDHDQVQVYLTRSKIHQEIAKRICFSTCLLDPNGLEFMRLVRIMAIVVGFVTELKSGVLKNSNVSTRKVLFPSMQFGKNNEGAPVGVITLTNDPKKHLDLSTWVFNVWWRN